MNPIVPLLLGCLLAGPAAASSQGQAASPLKAEELPVSLERIKRQLREVRPSEEATLRLSYYIEVYGKAPSTDLFRNFDLHNGPVPFGGPTHRDILNLVTPQEFRSPPIDLTRILQWLTRQAKQP